MDLKEAVTWLWSLVQSLSAASLEIPSWRRLGRAWTGMVPVVPKVITVYTTLPLYIYPWAVRACERI